MSEPLTVAVWRYDRTQALFDGRVPVRGHAVRWLDAPLETIFSRAFDEGAFDASELSLSNFLRQSVAGSCRYVGLPIFPSRSFRHGCFYVRADGPVRTPADLPGRRIGVREFSMTAALAARGALRDQYGVDTGSMRWVTGDVDGPERATITLPPLHKPLDLTVAPPGRHLSEMLLAGELDAVLAYKPIKPFLAGDPRVRRLFPDYGAEERAYYAAHRVFPLMHLIGLRADHAARDPGLGLALVEAFAAAQAIATEDLASVQALKIGLPWIAQAVAETTELMGPDPWPVGLASNRHALATAIRWSAEDGLIPHPVDPESLFLPATRST